MPASGIAERRGLLGAVLTDLRVRDLGVVEDLTLALDPGMTALTGETGAGKTLLVEALQLVLGQRSWSGLVRAGAEGAVVEARFERGDGELILGRSVLRTGRSRAFANDRMVAVATLAELAAPLVDIHGQHDQQSLHSPEAQRRILDTFGQLDPEPVQAGRRRLRELRERLSSSGRDPGQREREAELLRHQLDEIERARLTADDEDERLAEEEARLADLAALRESAAHALAVLDAEGESLATSAVDALGRATAALSGRASFGHWEARLRAALAEVSDVASDLREVVETWEDDPERLAEVQTRRRLLADLSRRYGGSLAGVHAFAETGQRRLEELGRADEEAARLAAEIERAESDLGAAEDALRRARQKAAPRLAEAAGARLRTLAMPGARFEVSVGTDRAGDAVRLLLGANPGEPVQPLAKVASGGELARAMLALRLVAAVGPETMVFDEVDAGVGGEAALALGRALREVSSGRQVLVVTHLAQVAAFADRQVAVRKSTRGGRTVTEAVTLAEDERVVELSRMLSGHPNSATARAHAEELLVTGRAPVTPVALAVPERSSTAGAGL